MNESYKQTDSDAELLARAKAVIDLTADRDAAESAVSRYEDTVAKLERTVTDLATRLAAMEHERNEARLLAETRRVTRDALQREAEATEREVATLKSRLFAREGRGGEPR